jgi:hypothetical protein
MLSGAAAAKTRAYSLPLKGEGRVGVIIAIEPLS